MTGAPERLRRRGDFVRLTRAGRRWATPGLVLQAQRRKAAGGIEDDAVRVGFTASRKVGGAVVRNRARRRLKAAVRFIMPSHARPGFDYVLIARTATAMRPWDALLGDLETAMKKVDGWCGDDNRGSA